MVTRLHAKGMRTGHLLSTSWEGPCPQCVCMGWGDMAGDLYMGVGGG